MGPLQIDQTVPRGATGIVTFRHNMDRFGTFAGYLDPCLADLLGQLTYQGRASPATQLVDHNDDTDRQLKYFKKESSI